MFNLVLFGNSYYRKISFSHPWVPGILNLILWCWKSFCTSDILMWFDYENQFELEMLILKISLKLIFWSSKPLNFIFLNQKLLKLNTLMMKITLRLKFDIKNHFETVLSPTGEVRNKAYQKNLDTFSSLPMTNSLPCHNFICILPHFQLLFPSIPTIQPSLQ